MVALVTEEELKQQALSFLTSQKLMVLGTSRNNEVWSATVHFAVTDDFEIIFFSRPDTRHTENIKSNPNVSAVITEASQKKKPERSIQLSGKARQADGVEWDKYFTIFEKKVKSAREHPDNIIYVIVPDEVWMINEELGFYNRTKVNLKVSA